MKNDNQFKNIFSKLRETDIDTPVVKLEPQQLIFEASVIMKEILDSNNFKIIGKQNALFGHPLLEISIANGAKALLLVLVSYDDELLKGNYGGKYISLDMNAVKKPLAERAETYHRIPLICNLSLYSEILPPKNNYDKGKLKTHTTDKGGNLYFKTPKIMLLTNERKPD